MTALKNRSVEALTTDSRSPDDREIKELMEEIPDWRLDYSRDGKYFFLFRKFKFSAYLKGVKFHGCVAEIAEQLQHHPEMLTEYGHVTVKWWSHSVGGIHLNDFILAAKCDAIYADVMTEKI